MYESNYSIQFLLTKDQFDDFELRAEFKISAHNSGIQFRSEEREDIAPFVHAEGCCG